MYLWLRNRVVSPRGSDALKYQRRWRNQCIRRSSCSWSSIPFSRSRTVNQKASKILGLIRRNFNHCPTHIKSLCYTTMVRPILEYGCSVWDPHFQVDIDSLERVQKRAARFATGNYRMETGNSDLNLQTLGWDTFEENQKQINLFSKS